MASQNTAIVDQKQTDNPGERVSNALVAEERDVVVGDVAGSLCLLETLNTNSEQETAQSRLLKQVHPTG